MENLITRLNQLKIRLLPYRTSPTGNYNDIQLEKARSYRVLVHAEIEHFLENKASECINNAIEKWNSNKEPSYVIIALLAAYHSGWSTGDNKRENEILDAARNRNNLRKSINQIINYAAVQYREIIKGNNGIKESNLKKLLMPIGIDTDDVESTWIA